MRTTAQRRKDKIIAAGNYLNRARYSSMETTQAIEAMDAVLDAGGFRMSEAEAVIDRCQQTIALMNHAKVTMLFSPDKEDE